MINIKTYLYMDELDFLDIIETPLIDGGDFLQLLLRFGFNFLVTGILSSTYKCNFLGADNKQ